MNEPFFTRFAEACGATNPLDLRVDLTDGGMLAEGSLPMPFVLVGRDDACDVTLADAEVNPRHAWLQVVSGRLYAIDLGSRTGLGWPNGSTGSGWIDENTPVRVGPFQLRLRTPVSTRPAFPKDYNPLLSDAAGVKACPRVSLEFRNGKRAKDCWGVNRFVTLIGRAPECKIHLTADDIASYHCGLVLTTAGLWVVDLSGRGVVVNGERMRVSPLGHAAELWVGRFLIGVQSPTTPHTPSAGRSGIHSTPRTGLPLSSGGHQAVKTGKTPLPEDEVALGAAPVDPGSSSFSATGSPAESPRMRVSVTGANGPVSQQIQLTSNPPKPKSSAQQRPVPRTLPTDPPFDLFTTLPQSPSWPTGEAAPDPSASSDPAGRLVRQISDLHAQIFTQSQQALMLLVQLFGYLLPEQIPAIQVEMDRVQALNAELGQLVGELSKRVTDNPPMAFPVANDQSPTRGSSLLPEIPMGSSPMVDTIALHDWVTGRVNALQKERLARWQVIIGLVRGKPG